MLGSKASPFERPIQAQPSAAPVRRPAPPASLHRPPELQPSPPSRVDPRPDAGASPLDFLLSAEGRVGRFDYWVKFYLPYLLAMAVCVVADLQDGESSAGLFGVGTYSTVFTLAMLWPSLMVNIKRCHDRDRSGWHLMVSVIPFVGSIILAVELGFLRGTAGENRYGADPAATP